MKTEKFEKKEKWWKKLLNLKKKIWDILKKMKSENFEKKN